MQLQKLKRCIAIFRIIIDDLIDTGGTIISASNLLLEQGAKSVLVGASHAVLSNKSVDKLLEPDRLAQLEGFIRYQLELIDTMDK